MSFGGTIGGLLKPAVGYIWVFNLNGIMLLALFLITAFVYPYDPPMVGLMAADSAMGGQ